MFKNKDFKIVQVQYEELDKILKSNSFFLRSIDINKPFNVRIMPNKFLCLIHTIISYNNSSKNIDDTWNLLHLYFKKISPKLLAYADIQKLMACKISENKIHLIRDISHDIFVKKISLSKISRMADCDILNKFAQYKGMNLWIIQMWLIFGCEKANVVPFVDKEIDKAIKYCWNVDKIDNKMQKQIFDHYSPFCTILSFILWKISNDLNTK